MRHFNITITGRVQGVGFRYSAYHEALDLGISGFVKNMPDGSVYIEAEGEDSTLEEFVEWCKQGPGLAYVKDIFVQEAPLSYFQGFEIRR